MAILNRIVNILILLLVIAAGVFSYMLFGKRESLTKGMESMAAAISNTAATLDDGGASGTKAAGSLKKADLDHKKDFSALLPKLNDTAKEIVRQRNDLAKALAQTGRELGAKNVKEASLRRVDNFAGECKNLQSAVKAYKDNANGVKNQFVAIGRSLKADVKMADLDGTGYREASQKIQDKAETLRKESDTTAGDIAYAKNRLGVSIGKYSTNTSKFWREAVDKRAKDIQKINSERGKFERLSKSQEKEISKLKEEKKALEDQVKTKDKEIARQLKIITDDGKKPEPALKLMPDSPECYKEVRGTVQYVNREYGFVQIDIGKDYQIEQEYGVMKNIVSFPLQPGLTMTVSRGSGENAEIVATILVKTVNKNNSICNVIKGNVADIREKDHVFFSSEDMAAIPAALSKGK
ncbi:MAG: hypothetical protein J6A21_08900 [Lentisphaeria bacterium]|nr:hypothetical protein [Lentisphaeria bacterium]